MPPAMMDAPRTLGPVPATGTCGVCGVGVAVGAPGGRVGVGVDVGPPGGVGVAVGPGVDVGVGVVPLVGVGVISPVGVGVGVERAKVSSIRQRSSTA